MAVINKLVLLTGLFANQAILYQPTVILVQDTELAANSYNCQEKKNSLSCISYHRFHTSQPDLNIYAKSHTKS